jgi:MFS family permease
METDSSRGEQRPVAHAGRALALLVVVYVLNFVDRQIPSILAEHLKRDLLLSDAQLGFLYGTAFAVFYAVFGIPLARVADSWHRPRLLALCLLAWSVFTALSGFARRFSELALLRFGVGVGEAGANPVAYSLLSDYFPRERRATVLAVYSSGIYLGSGLGLALGGLVVQAWDGSAAAPLLGLRGWQAAFLAVGVPGILLAALVTRLAEPRAEPGRAAAAVGPGPGRTFGREVLAVLPPFTLLSLRQAGASRGVLAANAVAGSVLVLSALLLGRVLGTPVQWWGLAVGVYAGISWAQSLALADAPTHALIVRTPSFALASLGFASLSFVGYAWGFWLAPFFVRVHGWDVGRAGVLVGAAAAAGGLVGVTAGGLLADAWRRRSPSGRLWVGALNALLPVPLALGVLWSPGDRMAFALCVALNATTSLWLGAGTATVQDLVLPRMRARAAAAFLLVVTLVGLALGPYGVGRLSVALGGLRPAMAAGLSAYLAALVFFLLAARRLAGDEESRFRRARAAGETE